MEHKVRHKLYVRTYPAYFLAKQEAGKLIKGGVK